MNKSNKSNKSNIVKGYNGIMDLDLNLIDKNHHKNAVDQYLLDIENYKKEQSKLPKKLRYENTIPKALEKSKIKGTFKTN